MLLLDQRANEKLHGLIDATSVINLSDWADFQSRFVNCLSFPTYIE